MKDEVSSPRHGGRPHVNGDRAGGVGGGGVGNAGGGGGPMRRRLKQRKLSHVGLLEWFRPGERQHVEKALADISALGVKHLRTGISWAEWHRPGAAEWYDWLFARLAERVEILPCFTYTPPSLAVAMRSNAPPRRPKDYADFLDTMIRRYDRYFDYVELWNEPNNVSEYDWTLDGGWQTFSEMTGAAAYWARHCGKKTVLGGMSPIDPHWLQMMFDRGVMEHISVVGIHGFPGTYELRWEGWYAAIERIREVLRRNDSQAAIWITEAGFSTWRMEERRQLREFLKVVAAPVDRIYWYSLYDLDPSLPTVDGFHTNEAEYHFGLKTTEGRPKMLHRLWSGGYDHLNRYRFLSRKSLPRRHKDRPALITGGAGFIGSNIANRLLSRGREVILYDNLSRPGVEQNIDWLRRTHGRRVQVELADIRDRYALERCVREASEIYHFAAQVAVTTSLSGPVDDFMTNAFGTVQLLEAVRSCSEPPPLLFTSTNKVYGALDDIALRLNGTRYEPVDQATRMVGIDESRMLDFYSPYGCSKGAADQYVLDYSRTYDLPTVVFRMSCIYGPHQFGTEDQGWVAHFLIQALSGQTVSIYGDGRQVRDILYVEDLADAMLLAQANIDRISGQAFNIGGGVNNTTSLQELLSLIGRIHGTRPRVDYDEWRVGDQRYYVSDTRRFSRLTGWSPQHAMEKGIRNLYNWLAATRGREQPAGVKTTSARQLVAKTESEI